MGSEQSRAAPCSRPTEDGTRDRSFFSSISSLRDSRQTGPKSCLYSARRGAHFRDTCSHAKSPVRPSCITSSSSSTTTCDARVHGVLKRRSSRSGEEDRSSKGSPNVSEALHRPLHPSLPAVRVQSLQAKLRDRKRELQGTSRSSGEGFRNSDRKSECIPDAFTSALRRAVRERKPRKVAVLLKEFPAVTRSALLFQGDCECLAAMNEIVARREADLLAACLKRGACTPEQIWPSDIPGGQGPSLSVLFSPLFVNDTTKGLSRDLDKHVSHCSSSSMGTDAVGGSRASPASSVSDASSVIHEPSRYTYLYLPRLPGSSSGVFDTSACLVKSQSHPAHSRKTRPGKYTKGGSAAVPSWLSYLTSSSRSDAHEKFPQRRNSEEAKRVARVLQRQRALRLGDIILLGADGDCVRVLLPHISRPSLFLVAAAARGTKEVVEALLRKGANPNTSAHGLTPINVAASSPVDPREKVELLLRHGAAPDAPLLPSAPHSAAAAPIVSVPAVPARAVPTVSDVEDLPALMHAVMTGDLAMAELLLQQGADPNIFVEYLGGLPTPLFQAVFWGDLKMVKLLCGYGADPYMVKQSGETLFDTAHRALRFALLRKPKHISRLPLPNTTPATCRQIRRILDECCSERASAAREAAAAAVARVPEDAEPCAAAYAAAEATAAALAAGPPCRAHLGFRAAWESRVVGDEEEEEEGDSSEGQHGHSGGVKSCVRDSSRRGMTGGTTAASCREGRTRRVGEDSAAFRRETSQALRRVRKSLKGVEGISEGETKSCPRGGAGGEAKKSAQRARSQGGPKSDSRGTVPLRGDTEAEALGRGLSLSFEVALRTPGKRQNEVEERPAHQDSPTSSPSSCLPRSGGGASLSSSNREASVGRSDRRRTEERAGSPRARAASRFPPADRPSVSPTPVEASSEAEGDDAIIRASASALAHAKALFASSARGEHSRTSAEGSDWNLLGGPVKPRCCSDKPFASGSNSSAGEGPARAVAVVSGVRRKATPSALHVSSDKKSVTGDDCSAFPSQSSVACASTACSSDS